MQLRGTVLIGERKKENGLRLNNWRDYLGANFFCFYVFIHSVVIMKEWICYREIAIKY